MCFMSFFISQGGILIFSRASSGFVYGSLYPYYGNVKGVNILLQCCKKMIENKYKMPTKNVTLTKQFSFFFIIFL